MQFILQEGSQISVIVLRFHFWLKVTLHLQNHNGSYYDI